MEENIGQRYRMIFLLLLLIQQIWSSLCKHPKIITPLESTTKFIYDDSNLNECHIKLNELCVRPKYWENSVSMNNTDTILFEQYTFTNDNYFQLLHTGSAIFKQCIFRNNNINRIFEGVKAIFIDCIFENNVVNHTMFLLENESKLSFQNCIFRQNIATSLFTIYSKSSLQINHSYFISNQGDNLSSDIISIHHPISSQNTAYITNSIFYENSNYRSVFYVSIESKTNHPHITINNTSFQNGYNNMNHPYSKHFAIINCSFIGDEFYDPSIHYKIYHDNYLFFPSVMDEQVTIQRNVFSSRSLLQKNNLNTSSTLRYFCVSSITAECGEYIYDPITNPNPSNVSQYTSNFIISDIPGTAVAFYVFAFDEFGDLLNTSEYSIFVSSNESIITTPTGIAYVDEEHYIISTIIDVGLNITNGSVLIQDQNDNANNISIQLIVKGCDEGYFQNPNDIDPGLFSCDWCETNTYTLKNGECKSCESGSICYGGNNVFVHRYYYAGFVSNDADYLTTALCAAGYCCDDGNGCNFHDKSSLCMNDCFSLMNHHHNKKS